MVRHDATRGGPPSRRLSACGPTPEDEARDAIRKALDSHTVALAAIGEARKALRREERALRLAGRLPACCFAAIVLVALLTPA